MNTHLDELFVWLLRVSWQASVLVLIVLAVQWLFQKQLSARWRYALWFLVIARLALPILPSSPVSIFNFSLSRQLPASTSPFGHSTELSAARPLTPMPFAQERPASAPPAAHPAASQLVSAPTRPDTNFRPIILVHPLERGAIHGAYLAGRCGFFHHAHRRPERPISPAPG
jgi:hypothetical protein